MSLIRNHTGFHLYPLSTGASDTYTWAGSDVATFNMKNVPIAVGDQAYYAYGIHLSFTGSLIQAGGGGSIVDRQKLIRALVDSIELRNAWHGTPLSSRQIKGSMLPIVEFVGCGYQSGQRGPGEAVAANGTYNFRVNVLVPLCVGLGPKPHHTAQLALFYKQAQLDINTAATSVLTGITAGASFGTTTVRASLVMLPEKEIRLGPAVEWVDYQSSATSGQEQIILDSFGNKTGLSGVIPNAGVVWMGALTSVGGLPGSFSVDAVTRYSFPWRGQVEIRQIDAFATMQLMAMGPARPDSNIANSNGSPDGYVNGFPYSQGGAIDIVNGGNILAQLLFFPMVTPAMDLELTKIQLAKGSQSYFLSGPSFSGTNHTLVQHLNSFDDPKREDAVKQIVDSGLAKTVIGQQTDLGWVPKLIRKNETIDPNKLRFIPFRLVRREPKRVITPTAAIGLLRARR